MVTAVVLFLSSLIETALRLCREYGLDFVLFMFEALEKPWMVRRA